MLEILLPIDAAVSAASGPAITSDAYKLLSAALDPSGWICIRGLAKGKPALQSFFAPGNYQGAVAEAMRLDGIGYNALFATSTFSTKDSAKAENVNAVKCFKIDLDIGKDDPKKYASKKEAVAALLAFCANYGFPTPVIVDSGGGLHCYFIMTEALPTDAGKLLSERFKALLLSAGVKIDVTVTGDVARVLRVPGTHNLKNVVPRVVTLKTQVDTHDTDLLCDLIDAGYNQSGSPQIEVASPSLLAGMALPDHLKGVTLDKTTQGILQGKPKSFHVLLKRCMEGDRQKGCAQIAYASEHQASIEEPRWRSALSVAWHCEDGKEAIHWISRGHNEYDHDETVKKASLTTGPHTCKEFMKNWPTECDGCPNKGKITSPIQLGVDDSSFGVEDSGISNDNAVIAKLAALSKVDYDRARAKAAKELGVRTSTLDALVDDVRAARENASNSPFVEVEPWDIPVNVAELLHEVSATIRRHIVCEKEVSDAAALWAAMTWVVDALKIAPLAIITAPEKRCGKSEFRRLIAKFVCRPLEADGMSASVLFRGFDLWKPTLLVDEFDAWVQDDEDLRGIFNAGHQRGGCIWRCVGEDHEPKQFDVFGPKLLAGIGKLPGTMMDRAIIFELRRKLAHEKVERLRYADDALFDVLRRKLARFEQDYIETVHGARPSLPDALNDRQQDNWEPLLAIADIAGHDWPELARQAALKLSAEKEDAASMGVELLADIREIFAERNVMRLFSYQLVHALCRDERRWSTHNRGGNITSAQVARILKGYGIGPKSMRIDLENAKGYAKEQFADTWERYLPPTP